MTIKIDNFSIVSTPETLSLRFIRSFKDWWDLAWSLAFTGGISWFTFKLLQYGFAEMNYTVLGIGTLFIFVHFITVPSSLSKIIIPVGEILTIDKLTGILAVKTTLFHTDTYSINDIGSIMITGKQQIDTGPKGARSAAHCIISLRMKAGTMIPVIFVNTRMVVNFDRSEIEAEVHQRARKIAMEMNRLLKAKYSWGGFGKTE